MTTPTTTFEAPQTQDQRRAKYLLLLEKAKSLYFATHNLHAVTLLGRGEKAAEIKVFDLVTKDTFHNEHVPFCPSALTGKGVGEWLRAVVKFFYDNKGDRFPVELASLYFGKSRSRPSRAP